MRTAFAVLVAVVVLLALGPQAHAFVILGTGTGALLGRDLTDPDNNINDNVKTNPPYYGTGYDWIVASASSELWFSPGSGSEASLDVFDNKVGGGEAKYCCGGAPWWVAVELKDSFFLTHFTMASSNDSPNRDPDVWQLLGSSNSTNGVDGTWNVIYSYSNDGNTNNTQPWTARNQVIRFDGGGVDFSSPGPYSWFKLNVDSAAGTLGGGGAVALGELELFGVPEPATLSLLGLGGLFLLRRRGRKSV